jgi:hypothetical protein
LRSDRSRSLSHGAPIQSNCSAWQDPLSSFWSD